MGVQAQIQSLTQIYAERLDLINLLDGEVWRLNLSGKK
jgi:hypothetical protein